jgi:YqaJ-like viral recombinase domain
VIFHDVIQGSPDWYALRRGIPTASNFDRVMTPRTRQYAKAADSYVAELIGEQMSHYLPEGVESFTSRAMKYGIETEAEARRYYSLHREVEVFHGGFCQTDDKRFGSSPDSLVGDDGVLEIKCPQATAQVLYLLDGNIPDIYLCQVHGHLIVTGRTYCDFLSYHCGLPPLLIRTVPNDFTAALRAALEEFWVRYVAALEKIQGMQ